MVFQSVPELYFSSAKGIEMFPKWAMCLLNYYDLCGFYMCMADSLQPSFFHVWSSFNILFNIFNILNIYCLRNE